MAKDRSQELLFGILALQFHFVTREQLIAATTLWGRDRTRELAEILEQQEALSRSHRELLTALFREYESAPGDRSLAGMLSASSLGALQEELRLLGDDDIEQTLERFGDAIVPDHCSPSVPGAETLSLRPGAERFQILRPHATGGLGRVSVALDNELHREVALKEIKSSHAADRESRARFIQEAEITGSLEHPGIVPVYGLGTYDDGRPFYVMRFIRGDSLKDAIALYHEQDDGRASHRPLELRRLLGRFIDVCNAVEYAHSRGVLHRDLKPSNIMLGRYGETLVVDWGLAKAVDREERHHGSGEATLRPSGSGSSLTLDGQAVGTPAYMSPEQATGRLEELREATDIYSLGATLYCLLTGQPPFRKGSLPVLLACVRNGKFPPPRQVRPAVPRPLEAVCLRAMALAPDDRYGSATDLAIDVERWMADEPVTCHRERLSERAIRVSRRHKTATLASIVMVTLLALGASATALLLDRERVRTQRQLHLSTALRLATLSESSRGRTPHRAGLLALESVSATASHDEPVAPLAWSAVYNTLEQMVGHRVATVDEIARELRFSPDGQTMLVRSVGDVWWRFDLRARDVQRSRRMLTPLDPTVIPARSILSSDWKVLARAIGDAGVIEVRDVPSGTTRTLRTEDEPMESGEPVRIFDMALSPNAHRVAAVRSDRTCLVWDLSADRITPAHTLQLEDNVHAVRFSPDSSLLTMIGPGGLLAFQWQDGTPLQIPLPEASGYGYALTHSADSRWIVSATTSGLVRMWDMGTRPPAYQEHSLSQDPTRISSLDFSPDSQFLVAGLTSGSFSVLHLSDQNPIASPREFSAHSDSINLVTFSADSRRFAIGSRDRSLSVWRVHEDDITLETRFHTHDDTITIARFAADSNSIYTGGLNGLIRKADVSIRQDSRSIARFEAGRLLRGTAAQGDEPTIITSGNSVLQWDLQNPWEPPRLLSDTPAHVIGISGNGRWLLGWFDAQPGLIDLQASSPAVLPIGSRTQALVSLDISDDGTWVAVTGKRTSVWHRTEDWPVAPDRVFNTLNTQEVRFSPDHRHVVLAGRDVRLWELQRPAAPSLALPTPETLHRAARFSPDGRWLAVGGTLGPVYLWDMAAADRPASIVTLSGHTSEIRDVAFDPSGRWMATAGADHTVRLWDMSVSKPSGAHCIVFRPRLGDLISVGFADRGRWLFTGDTDGSLVAWSMDRTAAANELRERIGRGFTPPERREFQIE